jgi:tetratricopeptide (TPR) repeat protein
MKKVILLMLAVVTSIGLFAQKGKIATAEFELQSGNFQKAKDAIDQAVVHEKTIMDPSAWKIKGDVYQSLYVNKVYPPTSFELLFQAYEAYKRGFELESNPKRKAEYKQGLDNVGIFFINEGIDLLKNKDDEGAFKFLEQCSELTQYMFKNKLNSELDTIYILYAAYAAQNLLNYSKAIELYTILYELDATDHTVYSNLADLLVVTKADDALVLSVIEKGRAKFPTDKNLIISELNYYLSKNRATEVVDKMEAAIKVDPSNPELYFALGSAYDQMGELDKSKLAYESAINLNPQYYDAYYNLGALYYNQAVKIIETMNALPDNDLKGFKQLEGERNALYLQALPYLEKAYQINPDGVGNKAALKEIYARMSMFEKLKTIK